MYAKDSHLESIEVAPELRAIRGATEILRAISRLLDAWAERLSPPRIPRLADPVLEFYADAGAPEGALYIDGKLVGHVIGVSRL